MEIRIKKFGELSGTEVYEILRSRAEIFTVEQEIICVDPDGVDYYSLHCFLWDNGRAVAYLRAYYEDEAEGVVKVGRVITLTHGKGLGRRLMEESLPAIKEHFKPNKIVVNAQSYAEGYYSRFGFVTLPGEFLEENIPHVRMEIII